jgi:L-alanine-DL-glutamate epimerase-like enolase superfamily enzyme
MTRISRIKTHPIQLSIGAHYAVTYLIVSVESNDGPIGFGEVCDSFGCSHPRAFAALIDEALAPLLMEENPLEVDRLFDKMRGWTRRRLGDQALIVQAISGVEVALWDLCGKLLGRSVADLFERRDIKTVPVYASGMFIGDGTPDWHAKLLEPYLQRGVKACKARIGDDFRTNLKALRELRRVLGSDVAVMIDGNEHYCLRTAETIAHELAEIGIRFFEEPIPQNHRQDIERLVAASPVDIAYGEHLFTGHDFSEEFRHSRLDVAQPDATICGGLAEARRIASLAAERNIPLVPHCAAGPIAMAANLHLCATVPNAVMLEYPYPLQPTWEELCGEPVFAPATLRDGGLALPTGPGLGVPIDESRLAKPYRRSRRRVRGMPQGSIGRI